MCRIYIVGIICDDLGSQHQNSHGGLCAGRNIHSRGADPGSASHVLELRASCRGCRNVGPRLAAARHVASSRQFVPPSGERRARPFERVAFNRRFAQRGELAFGQTDFGIDRKDCRRNRLVPSKTFPPTISSCSVREATTSVFPGPAFEVAPHVVFRGAPGTASLPISSSSMNLGPYREGGVALQIDPDEAEDLRRRLASPRARRHRHARGRREGVDSSRARARDPGSAAPSARRRSAADILARRRVQGTGGASRPRLYRRPRRRCAGYPGCVPGRRRQLENPRITPSARFLA